MVRRFSINRLDRAHVCFMVLGKASREADVLLLFTGSDLVARGVESILRSGGGLATARVTAAASERQDSKTAGQQERLHLHRRVPRAGSLQRRSSLKPMLRFFNKLAN